MRPFRFDILHVLALSCAALLLVLLASAALSQSVGSANLLHLKDLRFAPIIEAHSWYDPGCCNDFDCAPVASSHVQFTDAGVLLTLGPGDHKFVREPKSWVIPYDSPKLRESKDNDTHACVGKVTQVLFCLYLPPMGM
jgi:hypothetical protein